MNSPSFPALIAFSSLKKIYIKREILQKTFHCKGCTQSSFPLFGKVLLFCMPIKFCQTYHFILKYSLPSWTVNHL